MKYPKRKSIRLKNYDYSSANYYFVTICAKDKKEIFGKINEKDVNLSKIGDVVKRCLENLVSHFKYVSLDCFIIMPNHIHFVLEIKNEFENIKKLPLSRIIAYFKTECKKQLRKNCIYENIWQRNFYEHIIRNEREYKLIYDYVVSNPAVWIYDKENQMRIAEKENETEKIIYGK